MTNAKLDKIIRHNNDLIKSINSFTEELGNMIQSDIDRMEIHKAIDDLEFDVFHLIVETRRLVDDE